jgi:hypothetical protein
VLKILLDTQVADILAHLYTACIVPQVELVLKSEELAGHSGPSPKGADFLTHL